MESWLKELAPQARCYKCKSPQVTRLCHHCRRIGCSRHIVPTPTIAGFPLSREMSRLGLGKKPAYHCDKCAHAAGSLPLTIGIATAMAVTALIVGIWVNLFAGLILILPGVALVGGSYVYAKRRAPKRQQLPLPVLPKVDELKLTEELRGKIRLERDGTYSSTPEPVQGRLAALLELGKPDRQRLERYLRKNKIEGGSDVTFSAGSLVLHGKAGIDLSRTYPRLVIPLEGTTSRYPVFSLDAPRASSPYRASYPYSLVPGRDATQLPVWITPAIVPRSDRRALELQVQWVDIGPPGSHLVLEEVKSLKLWIPARWGDIEGCEHIEGATGAVAMREERREEEGQAFRAVEWLWLRPGEKAHKNRRLDVIVQLSGRVATIDCSDIVFGRLEAVFTGALSGLEGVSFFGPLGNSMESRRAVTTRVVLDFHLSLAKTRYENIRLIPDRNVADDEFRDRPDEFPSAKPNDETVIRLTNDISGQGYYLKRIIENPPRSGASANRVQRYWDIAGRRYPEVPDQVQRGDGALALPADRLQSARGVYPVDFHIVLTGEEVYHGGINSHSGSTSARLTVQGSYANSDMRDKVEQEWLRLHKIILESLERSSCPVRPAASLMDDWPGPGDGLGPSNGNGTDPMYTPRSPARLLELLGLLDEALLHGRISDERYWEMRKRAEQQLGG